ncbi:MAG: hypothetical protein ACHQ3P_11800 [Candidatus Limnocylindrales bacterium]
MAVAASLALAACSAASTPSPSAAPIVAPPVVSPPAASDTPEPSTAEVSSAPASSGATAVPTAIDPCTLVTQAEASQLTGSTYGPGKESETAGHLKVCTYGGQTPDVFGVDVLVAPDVATAQAGAAAVEAEAKAKLKGATIADLSGLGDKAVWLHGAGELGGSPINAAGIYVLSGATFFDISDIVVGKSAPSETDFVTQATTALGRLP